MCLEMQDIASVDVGMRTMKQCEMLGASMEGCSASGSSPGAWSSRAGLTDRYLSDSSRLFLHGDFRFGRALRLHARRPTSIVAA